MASQWQAMMCAALVAAAVAVPVATAPTAPAGRATAREPHGDGVRGRSPRSGTAPTAPAGRATAREPHGDGVRGRSPRSGSAPVDAAKRRRIVHHHRYWEPKDTWNGHRVYLSSPRHSSSGNRGECGQEENINGGEWNRWAAAGKTTGPNLRARGYKIAVSPNTRDDGWLRNRNASDNWNAHVHIATHTNALTGCDQPYQAFVALWDHDGKNAKSAALALHLVDKVGRVVPSRNDRWEDCDINNNSINDHSECDAKATHRAYVELLFHDHQAAVDWFEDDEPGQAVRQHAWTYGEAVDAHLGYPGVPDESAPSSLDRYPGFGRSPDAALRDDTIAYYDAFQRERLLSQCMARAGFAYHPAPSYPEPVVAQIADGLGIAVAEQPSAASRSPAAANDVEIAALDGGQRDRYYRRLFAESAADVAEATRTQAPPSDFATGGCVGKATRTIGSVWALERRLRDELERAGRSDAGSAQISAARSAYEACARGTGGIAAPHPGELADRAAADPSLAAAATAVGDECDAAWNAAARSAESAALDQLADDHAAALARQKERYGSYRSNVIPSDREFGDFLTVEAARITALLGESGGR